MGRHKIYQTEEARHEAEKQRKRKWYYKNSEQVKQMNMAYYWKHKQNEKTNDR